MPSVPTPSTPDLIITADDLGASESTSRAIVTSMERGYVTQASMMVNLSTFEDAVVRVRAVGRERQIGLHLNLTSGRPLTDAIAHCDHFCNDGWFRSPPLEHGFLPLSARDRAALAAETRAQFGLLRDHGFPVLHFDSHHHVHLQLNMLGIILPIIREFGVRRVRAPGRSGFAYGRLLPVKQVVGRMLLAAHGFRCAQFLGDAEEALQTFRRRGRPVGSIEIMTHPDLRADGVIIDGARHDRLVARLRSLQPFLGADLNLSDDPELSH